MQAPREDLVSPLVSVFEGVQHLQLRSRSALTVPEHIRLEDLLDRLDLLQGCQGPDSTNVCQAWYDTVPLVFEHPIPGRSGYGIVTQLRPRPPPNIALAEHVGPALLQLDLLISKTLPHDRQPQDTSTAPTEAVRLIPTSPDYSVPTYVEIIAGTAEDGVCQELQAWGPHCRVHRFGLRSDCLCIHPEHEPSAHCHHYMLCHDDPFNADGAVLHTAESALTTHQRMELLCQFGYERAVIVKEEIIHMNWHRVRFLHCAPQIGGSRNTFEDYLAQTTCWSLAGRMHLCLSSMHKPILTRFLPAESVHTSGRMTLSTR